MKVQFFFIFALVISIFLLVMAGKNSSELFMGLTCLSSSLFVFSILWKELRNANKVGTIAILFANLTLAYLTSRTSISLSVVSALEMGFNFAVIELVMFKLGLIPRHIKIKEIIK